jgi:hypothetical protein
MNGDARTEKDVKNEGRTDYVYESTGSSDKKYFWKNSFLHAFRRAAGSATRRHFAVGIPRAASLPSNE